jgi:cysteinyl-tRNA synthetase
MALRFYNTLSQRVEEFLPARDNTVRMYTCGPTVYDYAHIGNFRTFTFLDILRKWLRASGFRLDHVMNITDVDDKIIRNAVAQHKTLGEYTEIYTKAFLEDCATLRLERPERLVPATEHIDDMVGAIERLGAGNHTYTSDGRCTSEFPPSPNTASSRTTISAATWRARASMWTNTKRPTPATSRCGKRPRKASRSGPPPSAPAAPDGTSSAPRWPSSTWARRWIFTPAASI